MLYSTRTDQGKTIAYGRGLMHLGLHALDVERAVKLEEVP